MIVWFTGSPGAGKTTLANAVRWRLVSRQSRVGSVLDGDHLRKATPNLGYDGDGRLRSNINAARLAAKSYSEWDVVLLATVSPTPGIRAAAEKELGELSKCLMWVHVKADEARLRERRTALYAAKDANEIDWVDYVPPDNARCVVDTGLARPGPASLHVLRAIDGRARGLGDVVEGMLKRVGIENCGPGCNGRRLSWNELSNRLLGRQGLS